MNLLSFRMRWIQLLIYKIHTRDDEKLCFAEKTKSIILQKSGGCHGTPGTPGVDGPVYDMSFRKSRALL